MINELDSLKPLNDYQNGPLLRYLMTIFVSLIICSCQQHSTEKQEHSALDAKALNDSAIALSMKAKEDRIIKALKLLDQAIEMDSTYYIAYWNKLTFLQDLGRTDEIRQTFQKFERQYPFDPRVKMRAGIFYENTGDSVTGYKKYTEAYQLYEAMLDTMDKNYKWYSLTLADKAYMLMLLGHEKEGKEQLQQIYNQEQDESIKGLFEPFLNMSRKELIKGLNSN